MKKIFISGIVALLATMNVAHATDNNTESKRDRLFRFDFKCEFEGNHHHSSSDREFEAVARVFAQVRDHQSHSTLDTDDILADAVQVEGLRNLLAVARDGNLFYSDGGLLISKKREVIIAAATGQKIAIVIPRRDHDSVQADWMKFESFLVLDDHKVPGHCEVRARPVERGHEYDEENTPVEQGFELN